MKRMLQLSDIHLCKDENARVRGNSPQQRFEAAMRKIADESCDFLLLAGDVSDDGSPESYRRVIAACDALGCRWGWIPGNHDDPEVMKELKPLLEETSIGEWALLGLNSHVPGWDGGEVDSHQLERLGRQLREANSPSLVAIHHPPISQLPEWMNAISLRNKRALLDTITSNATQPCVILSGHIHHALEHDHEGIRVMTSPGCVDQFSVDGTDFHVEADILPGYLRLSLDGQQIIKEVVRLDLL